MDDGIDAVLGDQPADQGHIAGIALDEGCAFGHQPA